MNDDDLTTRLAGGFDFRCLGGVRPTDEAYAQQLAAMTEERRWEVIAASVDRAWQLDAERR
jgi:hypothetical protein